MSSKDDFFSNLDVVTNPMISSVPVFFYDRSLLIQPLLQEKNIVICSPKVDVLMTMINPPFIVGIKVSMNERFYHLNGDRFLLKKTRRRSGQKWLNHHWLYKDSRYSQEMSKLSI